MRETMFRATRSHTFSTTRNVIANVQQQLQERKKIAFALIFLPRFCLVYFRARERTKKKKTRKTKKKKCHYNHYNFISCLIHYRITIQHTPYARSKVTASPFHMIESHGRNSAPRAKELPKQWQKMGNVDLSPFNATTIFTDVVKNSGGVKCYRKRQLLTKQIERIKTKCLSMLQMRVCAHSFNLFLPVPI